MESAFHWTHSHTAASVTMVTAVPCVTNRGSCSTPAVACPANTVAAKSQTREMPTVTVKVGTPGNFVTQVRFLCLLSPRQKVKAARWFSYNTHIRVAVFQSLSVEGSLCGTSTRCREVMPSARQHAWCLGWSAPALATQGPAAPASEWSAGNTPLNAAMEPPSARKWKRPSSAAAWAACSTIHSHFLPLQPSRR